MIKSVRPTRAKATGTSIWLPRTLGQRLVGVVALVLAGITVVVGFDLWRKTYRQVEISETSRLEGVAAALALILDGDAHEKWSDEYGGRDSIETWDEAPADLLEFREILLDTKIAAKIKSPIYTLRLRDEFADQVRADPSQVVPDAMEFLVTSATAPYWRHTYQYRPEMAPTLFGATVASCHSYEDEHGDWLSAYAPVKTASGDVVGLLEVDAPIDTHLVGAKYHLTGHVAGLLLCFFGSLLLVGVLHTDMRRRGVEIEKLALVATRTDNGVLITDPNGTIEWTNDGFSRLTGWEPREAQGQQIEDRLRGTDADGFRSLRSKISSGAPATCELESLRKSGEAYWTSLDLQPIRNENGRLTHWVIVQSDITQQKNTERLMEEARDRAIENARLQNEFLANVGHELRTPLNGVLGMSDLLGDTDLDEDQMGYLGVISRSARALVDQITELMEYARLQAGTAEVEAVAFAPEELVGRIAQTLQPETEKKNLRLEIDLSRELPSRLLGDSRRIEQVFLLLLNNAIKFTAEGSIRVVGSPACAGNVRFEVKDTGIGIAEDRLAHIFESFRQGDGSTTRQFGGKGLGLAMASRLVEVLGGEIGVESELGVGSTFWFILPLEEASSEGVVETLSPDGEDRLAA